MILKLFKKALLPNIPKTGDNIEIISCPRRYDNADAFAGWTGIVTNHGDWIEVLRQDNPAVLVICSPDWQHRIKWRLV